MIDGEFRYYLGGHIRFKKHPKEDELTADWCPLCGEKLADFKIETRVNHDRRHHPGYHTTQTGIKRNNFFGKEDLK